MLQTNSLLNRPKSILVIAGGTYVSGAELVTIDILQGLKAAGHNLFCITSGWTDGDFGQRLSDLRIEYKAIKLGWYYGSKIKWSVDSFINYPGSFIKFLKFTSSKKFDLVYAISFRPIALLYPLLKKNIILHVHDPNSHSKQNRFFLNIVDRKILKYIAVSNFIKKDLIKCGIDANKIEVVHNGTSSTQKANRVQKQNTCELVIGIVGQIIRRKGHEDVLEALRILKSRNLNVSLTIVGKGDKTFIENLKLLISEYNLVSEVTWRTFKENPYEIYEGIDVVVAPTRNDEPFALIALEANMQSIPVIASNKGGFPESIEDGLNGFLVEASNPNQLVEKITRFYDDRQLVTVVGDNGRKIMLESFTKEIMILNIEKLIKQL